MYIDGELDPMSDVSSQSISTGNSEVVRIGVFGDSERFYNGLIDEVRIYEAALDAEIIAALSEHHKFLDEKKYWRPSAYVQGSPGDADPLPGASGHIPEPGDIQVNEVLAHSDVTPDDWIELHNTTDHTISIGGWFLSDDEDDYEKFRIPAGATIGGGGYAAFDQSQFGDESNSGCIREFGLSENGEGVYIRSHKDEDDNWTGYYEEEQFGASEADVSFGRYFKESTGTYNFVAMDSQTPGNDNDLPKVGPIVINEIMYNPVSGETWDHNEYEYIELLNITSSPVALYEWDDENDRFVSWRFTEGIDFAFPVGTILNGGERLLVVKNPDAFAERYLATGETPSVQIHGPYEGRLDNEGEKLRLSKPGDEVDDDYYYIRIDQVNYDSSLPWPREANGYGSSLRRIAPSEYGNDYSNWQVWETPPL
jgi:hypothetical protein